MGDTVVYLAHYFGKGFPQIFKTDSAKVKGQTAVFESKQPVLGGIYMIIYNKNAGATEILLDNGSVFSMEINDERGKSVVVKGSPENERYQEYSRFMDSLAGRDKVLRKELAGAGQTEDSSRINKAIQQLFGERTAYQKTYIGKYPATLLTSIFKASLHPEPPAGDHYLEDGKTIDPEFAYQYIRQHYWDDFDFEDDRLINTPLYEPRLTEYFEKWVYQIPDTVIYEADKILKKTRNSKELFRYTLRTLTNNALKSNVMGMDEVFVHMVEQYYMKGDAYWIDSAGLAWYTDRARKLAPNMIGNKAPELNMQNVFTLKDMPLDSVSAKYTLIVIWSYECGVCKKEIPLLDSIYRSALKQKDLKIYSIASGGTLTDIHKFIENNHIEDWINVADVHNNTGFKAKYDAYSTPKMYLLDEKKIIIGKNFNHSSLTGLLEWQEKKNSQQP